MTEGKTFTTSVISGGLVNIPDKFARHHDVQKGDSVELKIVSHKRDDEFLYQEQENHN